MQISKHSATFLLIYSAVACGAEDPATDGNHSGAGGGGGAHGGASSVSGKGGSAGTSTATGGSAGSLASGGAATGGAATGGAGMGTGGTLGGAGNAGRAGAGAPTGGASSGDAGGTGVAGTGGMAGAATGGASTGGAGSGGAANGGDGAGGASTGGAGMGGRGGMSGGMGGSAAGMGGAGMGGKAGSGGGGSCDAPPAAGTLVGWASVSGGGVTTTTGGGNATPTTVTTLSEFQSAVSGSTAAVVYVKGKLAAGKITVGSNKTIAGICGAEIHGHLEISGSTNVIIRNIAIVGYGAGNCSLDPDYDSSEGCSSGNDAISVQKNAHHIWFDHCDISDGTDGNLDITNGANYVTVSWTKFHYSARTDNEGNDSTGAAGHRYSNLIGGTDSPDDYDDANALNVTWHHNWWADRVVERQPRVRFGKNHLFNNLWNASGNNYCVRAGKQARILVEQSVFSGVKDVTEFNNDTDQGTANIIAGNDNIYTNTSGVHETGGGGPAIGTLPYSYTADAASTVSAAVQSGAGPK